jgi:hypothetical protein
MVKQKTPRFYEFIYGGICLQKQDFEEAEKHYELPHNTRLRSQMTMWPHWLCGQHQYPA